MHLDRVAGAVGEEDVEVITPASHMRHTPLHPSRRPPPFLLGFYRLCACSFINPGALSRRY